MAEPKAAVVRIDERVRESARRVLPFKLTAGQRQTLKEIVEDLQRPHPMNRLLQGDVGSGKTVVALYAMLCAVANLLNGGLPLNTVLGQIAALLNQLLAILG